MTTETIGYVTSADGTRIGYARSGDGPPLVLVHGTTADHTRWAPVLPALEERFTVYRMDRRGRGLSGDTEPYAIEREYEDVAAVVESIGEPADLLGHSFGALCALEAALRCRNLRRLVLYEPPFRVDEPIYPPGVRERFEAMLEREGPEATLVAFFREIVEMSEADLEVMRAAPAWRARVAAAHTVVREFEDGDYVVEPGRFEGITAPVLLLSGSESPAFMQKCTKAAHAALPTSRIVEMPGQAHVAVSTAPDLFARLVVDFLTE